jgi:hypothetical protein
MGPMSWSELERLVIAAEADAALQRAWQEEQREQKTSTEPSHPDAATGC